MFAAGLALGAERGLGRRRPANLRLQTFGSDAQLTAVKHAIERFNQKYPNVKVEIAIDPITNGWGDYVTKVLSQFNASNAYDVYGTAIETFRTFETRDLFIPLDDYIAKNPSYSDFDPVAVQILVLPGQDLFHSDRLEQHHDQLQSRALQRGRHRLSQGLDLGPVPRGRQEADQA